MQFKDLELSDEILSAVELLGFTEMTEIQEKSIPIILEGKDVIGRSNTGTGKTAAFGIPVIEKIEKEKNNNHLYVEDGKLYSSRINALVQLADNKTEEREGTIKWVRSLVKVLHLMMCSLYLHILK